MNVFANAGKLKKLELNFARLNSNDIARTDPDIFPARANLSVETLKIKLKSAGRIQSLADPQWRSFLGMFYSVKHLVISAADFSQYAPCIKEVITNMTRLKTLRLPKCVLSQENMTEMFQ